MKTFIFKINGNCWVTILHRDELKATEQAMRIAASRLIAIGRGKEPLTIDAIVILEAEGANGVLFT